MKDKAKDIVKRAIDQGCEPVILFGHEAFRPVPSMDVQKDLAELNSTKEGLAALKKAFSDHFEATEDNMETTMFADVKISTYTLDALIGRRVDILATKNEDGRIVVARDVTTGEGFVLNVEATDESQSS